MKVTRVLNNNVLIGEEDGTSYLLMGLSIGFKRKAGSIVPSSAIERMFVLKNPTTANRLKEMIGVIPDIYFSFCTDVVLYITRTLKKEVSDSLYLVLTDHIHSSVERYRNGIVLKNALLHEIKRFYSDEFNVSSHVVDMINKAFDVSLDDDEAAFITFNIINSLNGDNASNVQEMTRLIQDILILIKEKLNIVYDEEDTAYTRFVTHLKYFCQKVFLNKDDSFQDSDMLNLVKKKYSREYETAQVVLNFVQDRYDYYGTEMDAMYLAIHIARVLNG